MIDVRTIATSSLGDRSYLAHDGEVALVIDPQRDIDRVLALADELGVRITHVAETHIHNDYVTGGLELARRLDAVYLVDARDHVAFDRTPAREGHDIAIGSMRLRPIATPGHTHHHLSYALSDATVDESGQVEAVFTGGSMLYGTTGRTDLVSPDDTVELTHAQYHSVRRLVDELPADATVFPTHGFGSFCSATPPSGEASTVGEQRSTNPALTSDEQDFVDTLVAGLGAYPAYYARMAPTNSAGPEPVDLSLPEPVSPDELRGRLEKGLAAGQWVVDLRERTAFAGGHLAGSLSFQLAQPFVTYLGWLLPDDADLTLIGETEQQVADARRELVRIGIDRLAGATTGPIDDLAGGTDLASYRVSDFAGLADRDPARVVVVDARTENERAGGGVAGSLHLPLHELLARRDEIPDGEVWIYCGSGYRASVAASLLAAQPGRHRDLVVVNDDWPHAAQAGLAVVRDDDRRAA
ncbi:MBL fold metallo-hydrolase [Actinomycetospora corticicola]|uniref:Glyoxylase-like metal-dependent hydrolase (Beta-lactamase superfamily II)/rhodanese-related sulfurtransferase n=1 Tax=Actinomycetospora corticicola TaxID=663602 RepID=A0A7Y9DTI0_9PSEU|nr:MBL fold metallo-hydrolase [Actinomycetospora corticicola]NYD35129.1 glyoxylase-like metal-dependent hydrolase (beta-lactamase superfamily II)/rhodanese-related sulfurtransferase [Actinomycetospora corticicola]